MAKQLIVSVNGREKKIAIIEEDKVAEFYIERGKKNQETLGNNYKRRGMRGLPGMQSAFVDIGLERDAFLYVSDFFDEEEEFERIVIDKSKKGTPEPEHAAAEQIALERAEREQRIEETHERVEPLQEEEPVVAAELSETGDSGRRKGRRGRRRSRWEKSDEPARPQAAPTERFQVPDTPFVAGDPSIERIIDEEETAANGEMFKDARLQERLMDQIHAVEFNLEDDFRSAEVGSLLSSGAPGDALFQRVDDDSDPLGDNRGSEMHRPTPPEAHLESFIDELPDQTMHQGSFQRISDEEEELAAASSQPSRRTRKAPSGDGKKRSSRGASKSSSKRKVSTKRSSKTRSAAVEASESYNDSEAHLFDTSSRAEFTTRRGGRRR